MKIFVRTMICSLLIFSAFGVSHAMGQFFAFENPLVGEKAPDFTLKATDGQDVNLAKFRDNQNTILFFWATWCPHCREQLGELNGRMGAELQKKGIKIVLIDVGETVDEVRSYIKKNKIPFPVLLDEESKVSELYNLVGVPTFIFIDQSNVVRAIEHGIAEDSDMLFATK